MIKITKMRSIIILLLLSFSLFSQPNKSLNDFSFTLHEETVNKVFLAIGEISGTNDYEVMFVSGKYHWKVVNPQIQIRPDSSQFICDALVNVGPFNYKTNVKGDVKITYDKVKDKIEIKIVRAIFELYTMVLDKKVHIKDIHLEDNFKEPFMFDGPRSYGTSMDVSLPDSVVKKIYIQPSDCEVKIRWQEVYSVCEVIVSDKPLKYPLSTPTPKVSTTPTLTSKGTSAKTATIGSSATTKSVTPAPTKTVAPQKK